jgi:flagellar protein FlaG
MDINATQPLSVLSTPLPDADHAPAPAAPSVPVSAAPAPAAAAPSAPPVGAELRRTLEHVAERLREYLRDSGRELQFSVDDDAHTTVIRVRDAATGEVIRQMPNEEALRVLRSLNVGSGTLLDLIA